MGRPDHNDGDAPDPMAPSSNAVDDETPEQSAKRVEQEGRGRRADAPTDIPWKGWLDVFVRIWRQMGRDNLGLVGAGVAFFAFLAIFPLLVAILSIYGLAADPHQAAAQIDSFSGILPSAVQQLLHSQMVRLTQQGGGTLGWGTVLGLLGALWSSARGVKSLMLGLNIAYDERERRGFIKVNLIGLGLTAGIIVGLVLALAGIIGVPAVLATMGLGDWVETVLGWARWPLLAVLALTVLAVLYRWGPDRRDAKWRWITPGALLSTLLWMGASALFSIFVRHFGNYQGTYGSLAAVVVMLFWLSLSAQIILIGAELNAEMEHQTAKDTTTSGGKPMGSRGAHVADTLGRRREKREGKGRRRHSQAANR